MKFKKNLILHLGINDKFIKPFVDYVDHNFSLKNHLFCLSPGMGEDLTLCSRVFIWNRKSISHYLKLILEINRARKIFLHGLFDHKICILLLLNPWNIKKTYWLVWGGDIYSIDKDPSLKSRLTSFFRNLLASRIPFIVTSIPGDYINACIRYSSRASWLNYLYYPTSHVVELPSKKKNIHENSLNFNILVGNSATESNKHLEIFKVLSESKLLNCKLYIPLTYGSADYKKMVIQSGILTFGDIFIPILDHISLKKYTDFLEKIHVAIFFHERQQAMSTIRLLVGMGKVVYMNPESTGYQLLKSIGVKIFDFNLFDGNFFSLSNNEKEQNRRIICSYYNNGRLRDNLSSLFK